MINISKSGKIALSLGIGFILLFAVLMIISRKDVSEKKATIDSKQTALSESKEDEENFYSLPKEKTKTSKEKAITNSQIKDNLLNKTEESTATTEEKEEVKDIKPSDKTLNSLAEKPIQWQNIYLKKGEYNYIIKNILGIPLSKLDVEDGLIKIYLTDDNYTNVKEIAEEYNYTLAKMYQRSSYMKTRTLFIINYINIDDTSKETRFTSTEILSSN